MTAQATPAATPGPAGIEVFDVPPGLGPDGIAALLAEMPEELTGLTRRAVQTGADSATAIYLAGEESASPQFGMIVVLLVPPRDDAGAAIAELQQQRWGDPGLHTVTASGEGDATSPAFREFWRTFPPGLFALPNQPVYFLLAYRAGSEHALMVIAASPAIRGALTEALAGLTSRG